MNKLQLNVNAVLSTLVLEASRCTQHYLEKSEGVTLTERDVLAINRAVQQLRPLFTSGCTSYVATVVEAYVALDPSVREHEDLGFLMNCFKSLAVLSAGLEISALTQDERLFKLNEVYDRMR